MNKITLYVPEEVYRDRKAWFDYLEKEARPIMHERKQTVVIVKLGGRGGRKVWEGINHVR